jgi:paired amphipathic helix protein Sin3a
VFAGQTHVLKAFHLFLAGRDPFHDHDSQQSLQLALSFLSKVKVIYTAAPCLGSCLVSLFSLMLPLCLQESPCISHEDYNDLIATLTQFIVTKTVGVEDVYRKVLLVDQWFLPNDLEGHSFHNHLCL